MQEIFFVLVILMQNGISTGPSQPIQAIAFKTADECEKYEKSMIMPGASYTCIPVLAPVTKPHAQLPKTVCEAWMKGGGSRPFDCPEE